MAEHLRLASEPGSSIDLGFSSSELCFGDLSGPSQVKTRVKQLRQNEIIWEGEAVLVERNESDSNGSRHTAQDNERSYHTDDIPCLPSFTL